MALYRAPGRDRVFDPLDDEGIGLLEVVVALLVLVTMTLGLMPLLMGSIKLSATNRDFVAANTFANAQLSALRDAFSDASDTSCASLTAREATNITDPAGTTLKAEIDVAACPTDFPDAAMVTVKVRNEPAASPLVTLSTQIVVTKA